MFWNLFIVVLVGILLVNLIVKILSCGIQVIVFVKDNLGFEELFSKFFCFIFWLIFFGFLEL